MIENIKYKKMFKIIKKEIEFGGKKLSIETGKIARQADASVVVTYGDTVILCALVYGDEPSSMGFFPLSVNYIEKKTSVGRIPGGFFKREGKLSDKEVLTSRVIDRSIRPLFPEGFCNEVQITATLLSYDKTSDTDILALIGSAAALAISGLPVDSVVAGVRVGFKDNKFIANPTFAEMEGSLLDLTFAGTRDAIFMVESEAQQLSEETMLEALDFASKNTITVIEMIEQFAKEVAKEKISFIPVDNSHLNAQMSVSLSEKISSIYKITAKQERSTALKNLRKEAVSTFATEEYSDKVIKDELDKLEAKSVRDLIFTGIRIDGRDTKTVRPINIEAAILPASCVHGSALFTRGETQALVSVTLGSAMDEQHLDSIENENKKEDFMLHYNFPSYSVGEVGRLMGPGRREVGHGKLAYKAIRPLLPVKSDFPYTIRVISEITESNGSSSMATVCGTSLALMSTGVPMAKHVAGVAMGLIKEGDKYAILTDIMGDEDHLGDMDFKVAGTRDGITALQMDIKIQGITLEIMKDALAQAKDGRYHILSIMESAMQIGGELSESAPRIEEVKIKAEKIGDVIGKGGATIKGICEATGAKIDITEDGTVKIFASGKVALEQAVQMVKDIVTEVTFGQIYTGKVAKIMQFGAIVSLFGNHSGMVHISEISNERVEKVEDYLKEGQEVEVLALGMDEKRRLKLSIKKAKKSDEVKVEKTVETNDSPDVVDFDTFVSEKPKMSAEKAAIMAEPLDISSLGSFGDLARNLDNK